MHLWDRLKRILDPAASSVRNTFTLSPRKEDTRTEDQTRQLDAAAESAQGVVRRIDRLLEAQGDAGKIEKVGDLSDSVKENTNRVKTLFRAPANKDIIIRDLIIASQPPVKATLVYMEGLVDKGTINESILLPLMLHAHLDHHVAGDDKASTGLPPTLETINLRLLPGHQTREVAGMATAAEHVLMGDSVLFVDGISTALAIETKGFPTRSIPKSENEAVIRGPQDAFTESFRPNVALVRRRLKDPRVVTELLTVGRVSHTHVAVMYIDGICNPRLVAEIKKRIEAVDVDHVTDSGVLDQFIEESPTSWIPQSLATERPDRVAAFLTEGHAAVFVDNSPYALIMPVNLWAFLQTAEDYYLRHPFGTLLRYLRFGALLIALLLPAFYIAAVNFHQEMIPTDLMLFIAATREVVPMPAIMEVFLMDVAWELIREAGVRVPNVIGSTLGLVGGLILGTAAVEAKLVSPILVVIIAITGLSSFAVPNYVAGHALRVGRFAFLLGAAFQGFFGLGVLFFVAVLHLAALKSYGAPILAPVAPYQPPLNDVIRRMPVYQMEKRPAYTAPLDTRRQDDPIRGWDPRNPVSRKKQSDDGGQDE